MVLCTWTQMCVCAMLLFFKSFCWSSSNINKLLFFTLLSVSHSRRSCVANQNSRTLWICSNQRCFTTCTWTSMTLADVNVGERRSLDGLPHCCSPCFHGAAFPLFTAASSWPLIKVVLPPKQWDGRGGRALAASAGPCRACVAARMGADRLCVSDSES